MALLIDIAEGIYAENARFLPRRRIESLWGVSSFTANHALKKMEQDHLLKKTNCQRTILAKGAARRARQMLQSLGGALIPLQTVKPATGPTTPTGVAMQLPVPTLCYEKLFQSLLIEISSGAYREGRRFLSRRSIQQLWGVSRITADNARSLLKQHGLLRPNGTRSACTLRPGAASRACLLLDRIAASPLPPRVTSRIKRNRLVHGDVSHQSYRLAVIHNSGNHSMASLLNELPNPTLEELSSGSNPRRHLHAFLHEALQYGCHPTFIHYSSRKDAIRYVLSEVTRITADGVAYINLRDHDQGEAVLAALRQHGVPIVAVNDSFGGIADSSITGNNVQIGYKAMQVLLHHGHRDIVLIDKHHRANFLTERKQGVLMCLADHDAAHTTRLRTLHVPTEGSARLRHFLDNRESLPSALLLLDTKPYPVTSEWLWQRNIRIPEDISVIACGPRSSTSDHHGTPDIVDFDKVHVAATALHQLLHLIHGKPVAPAVHLSHSYFPSGTVGKVPTDR